MSNEFNSVGTVALALVAALLVTTVRAGELDEIRTSSQATAMVLGANLAGEQFCKIEGMAIRAARAHKIDVPDAKPASREQVDQVATMTFLMLQQGKMTCADMRQGDQEVRAKLRGR